jgi:hypothetical protein
VGTKSRDKHSVARELDGGVWGHVSVSRQDRSLPSWQQVRDTGWLLYPGRFGIIVVAPQDKHVNISEVAHVVPARRSAVPGLLPRRRVRVDMTVSADGMRLQAGVSVPLSGQRHRGPPPCGPGHGR